ncbi:p100 [Rhizobium phage 16-3]|uniref:endonuclease VII n=1 Tax=Rhizobium phage 16-3 TaxID=10704 RepID=UPI00017BA65D|nr:endonuclease VII [Rhizobium phage 16-3]ABF71347.1 p100 [Rhizobium phage 16-3]
MTKDIDQKTGQEVMGRTCTKCGTFKLFAEFNKKTKAKYGVYNECRECQKISNRKSYEKDGKDKRYAYQKAKRAANPEQRKAWDAAYRERNPEKIKESQSKHYAKPEAKEKRRESSSKWAEENIEKVREKTRRSQAKRNKDPMIRAHNAMSRAIRATLASGKGGRRTFEILGYSFQEFKAHIEKQFQPGMSWENYGDWHIDHVIPKSIFNFESVDDLDFKRCWSLSNLQPLWATDNKKKKDKFEGPFQPSLALGIPRAPTPTQEAA